jgi:hypothetical protein
MTKKERPTPLPLFVILKKHPPKKLFFNFFLKHVTEERQGK